MTATHAFGELLKDWRARRRMSQLDLALDAEISQKHLSFIETGRSVPSRDMVIRLSEVLDMPLRERNRLLNAAGYAAMYLARSLDDPSLAAARAAIDQLLDAHDPYPALAIDPHWTLIAANQSLQNLLAVVADKTLLEPPINVLKLSLHPEGFAPFIANLGQWRTHILMRLRHQMQASGDGALSQLLADLEALPAPEDSGHGDFGDVYVPLKLRLPMGELSFFSTTTVFGAPFDVTLSEIAIEAFFPADAATQAILRGASA
ncbi:MULTISPECIES: helix-turn-helix transcriptional regulator [Asticcacaulis]|uniref:helix-turn-helix transcriptional regulator n=1 Tax=Asticcacaulis TaxID=76890 RepID=UPI001AEAD3DA|nr:MULTISPECIES: helix-turn-helix transcriptional regulator [Asticcacaulis]MBP2161747.1 transcriptional regulator with XRE-family HTH domain [Asticcacaulis solisilvae]MDR6802793.1 transcriptional regulator with XRE-family HTH domain [Asticcacaulis sp. BE141]